MSLDMDPPHIIHFRNAGTYDVFRQYLDGFGPTLDLNNLPDSTKTPGYIVSGDVVEKFPPAFHSSGFYNCAFIIQPENFPEKLRVLLKVSAPQDLERIGEKSFLAIFNPKYFLGPNGSKTFSLGPEQFVLWFSKAPLKASKKRPATSPIKSGVSGPKSLKLTPQKKVAAAGTSSITAAKTVDLFRVPPLPSWVNVSRNGPQNQSSNVPLDNSGEISSRSSRAGGHSLCSRSRHSHCAHSTCTDHHHCATPLTSCCRVAQHTNCCSRQCCSHNRSSGCHGYQPSQACHHGPPASCSVQGHFGSCQSGCGSRCCNDRETDHHGCCTKHRIQEAPLRSCNNVTGSCQRPGPSRSTEEPLGTATTVSGRSAAGNSQVESGWFVRNWVKQSTLDNERVASVGASDVILAPQDTQATCGDSFHEDWDCEDGWSSVSEQFKNRKTVQAVKKLKQTCLPFRSSEESSYGTSAAVANKVPAVEQRYVPEIVALHAKKGNKSTQNSRDSGRQGPSHEEHSSGEVATSQARSTGVSVHKPAKQKNETSENDQTPRQHARNQDIYSEQSQGSSKNNAVPPRGTASQFLVPQVSLATASPQKSGQQCINVEGHDRPEPQAHCSKDIIKHAHSLHRGHSQVDNAPKHLDGKRRSGQSPDHNVLESGSDSDDSDTSTLFFGKAQSLLLEGPRINNDNSKVPKPQKEDLDKAIVYELSSDDESSSDNHMKVDQAEEQSGKREGLSPEIVPAGSQLTCMDSLEPPKVIPQTMPPRPATVNVKRKKTIRQLFNPANSSWYFDPRNPGESALRQKHLNESGAVSSKVVDLITLGDGVAKSAVQVTITGDGNCQNLGSADGNMASPEDRSREPIVESTSQNANEDIIPPSDAEMPEQNGVIPPSDAETPDAHVPEQLCPIANETVDKIQAFVQEWSSDSSRINPERVLSPKCTTDLLSDLISESSSPSVVGFQGDASKMLDAFTSLHTAPVPESNVLGSTHNQDIVETAKKTDHPSNQKGTIEHSVDKTIAAEASSQQLVSDGESEVPSSQPLHGNKMHENLPEMHNNVGVDMSQTLCSHPPAAVTTSCMSMSIKLCEQESVGSEERPVSGDAGIPSFASLVPKESDVQSAQDQGERFDIAKNQGLPKSDGDPKNGMGLSQAASTGEDPIGAENTIDGAGVSPANTSNESVAPKPLNPSSDVSVVQKPANPSNDESVAPKPANPTKDESVAPKPAIPTKDESVAPKPAVPSNDESVAPKPANPSIDESVAPKPAIPSNDESVSSKPANPAPDVPTSQASSELNLVVTDSGTPHSHDLPPSDVINEVTKRLDAASRCSPDSTTEHLSEERLLNLEAPNSPASTVFYDAEARLEDEEEQNEEHFQENEEENLKGSAKTSSSSAENAEVSRRLTLPNQVFGVQVTIVDMKPSISTETLTEIVKGVCAAGCQSKLEYGKATKEKTIIRPCSECPFRRHHLCPICKKTGLRRPLCLQFFFEIHALIGSHKCLRLQVELEDAVKFLGTDVKHYLKKSAAALETVKALRNLCDSPDERRRRLQGQVLIRTEDRGGEVVPLLTQTQLSDFKLSKNFI